MRCVANYDFASQLPLHEDSHVERRSNRGPRFETAAARMLEVEAEQDGRRLGNLVRKVLIDHVATRITERGEAVA